MQKRKTVRRRTLMTFLLIGAILAQMIAGAGIGEAMQAAAKETETKVGGGSEEAVVEDRGQPESHYLAAEGNSRAAVSVEDYILNALKEGVGRIDVSAYRIPSSEIRVYDEVLKNHPELFYVASSYSYESARLNGEMCIKYYIPYYQLRIDETGINGVTKAEMAKMCADLEKAVEKAIASCIEPGMKPYEKVLTVHDYLILNCKYDYENLVTGTVPNVSYTAYGALINGEAVCEGYALAFHYIMTKLDIPCMDVMSDEMGHMWNVVQLGGKWYHVDVTWDDPVWDSLGLVSHTYFLLSDSKISKPLGPASKAHQAWAVMDGTDPVDIVADVAYDEAFWADVWSAICFYNGGWYYSKYQRDGYDYATAVKLVRRESLLSGSEEVVDTAPTWPKAYSSYMCLAKSGENLYYNTPTEIRRLGKDGSISALNLEGTLGAKSIFGFAIQDGNFLCAPYESYWWGMEKQTDIRMVSAADADFKIVGNSQVDNSDNQNKKDTPNNPKTPSLKKGNSVIKGNVKFVVLNPGKKTVSVEGVASAKGKKFAVNIPSTVVINGSTCKVTEVKKKGFAKFAKITKVTFGKNITKVGGSAFDGCKKLKTLAFKGTKVPAFNSKAFKGTASKVNVKLAKKMSKKNKTSIKKKLKKAGIKKIR